MFKFDVVQVIAFWLVMWLFNSLTYFSVRTKDIANSVIIILLIIFVFWSGKQ